MEKLIIYLALNNEIEKYNGVENLSEFGSHWESVMADGHKVASKLKRDNPEIISIHYYYHRLIFATHTLSLKRENFLCKTIIIIYCASFIN